MLVSGRVTSLKQQGVFFCSFRFDTKNWDQKSQLENLGEQNELPESSKGVGVKFETLNHQTTGPGADIWYPWRV